MAENLCYVVEFDDGLLMLYDNAEATKHCRRVRHIIEVKDSLAVIDLIGVLFFTERTKNNHPDIYFKIVVDNTKEAEPK